MKEKILIVEDQFVEADYLRMMLTKAGYRVTGMAHSVLQARESIDMERPDIVLLDIFLKGKLNGIDLARELKRENIAFVYLSATSNEEILLAAKTTEPYGFLLKPFREKELLITLDIAQYRHEHSRESRNRRKSELALKLDETAGRDAAPAEKWLQVAKVIQQEVPFDFIAFDFDARGIGKGTAIGFLRIGFDEYQTIGANELSIITGKSADELNRNLMPAADVNDAAFFDLADIDNIREKPCLANILRSAFQIQSQLSFPVPVEDGEILEIGFFSRRPGTYSTEHISLLHSLQQSLINNLRPAPDRQNASGNTRNTGNRNAPLNNEEGKVKAFSYAGIVGKSHLLLNVFDQMAQVAPFDTAVLVLGESGTGKERIADCIHDLSPRKGKPLVKINCVTLPATLIESELFGHEKGAFTGAESKRIGKFEQANGGTIFLDEIGEMPVEMQAKLLRVLQEKEIEPIGGKSPVKIDVRIVAATNRNLEKEVAAGRFRLDLYYRLNVFPIALPPLRERVEDIGPLVQHFLTVFNRKAGKKITGISDKVLKSLAAYHWPGNIRELENVIERAVLMAKGQIIDDISLPPLQIKAEMPPSGDDRTKTIHENERDYIISVLKKCKGRVWGSGGAAELLNLPPSTLKSRMKKLGIKKNYLE